jgi:hypothetical protein
MSQAFRPRAEEGALALALHEKAERVGATLVIGPWRNVTALRMVSLETCFVLCCSGRRQATSTTYGLP